jgi:hypothetical protein
MSHLDVNGTKYPARATLVDAIETAWQRLARPGTWWNGEQRIAIAAQVRAAGVCAICAKRKAALSPYGGREIHAAVESLSVEAVEAIHRVSTDASRCTEKWVRQITEGDLTEEQYVEIVSIVATVTGLDSLDRALGRSNRTLPLPQAGEPTRHRPAGAVRDLAWVATLSADTIQPEDPDPFTPHGSIHIHRAMSLVPQEVINFFDLDVELYLKDREIRDFEQEFREISHAQIELIAGRASAINGCYY